MRLLTIYVVVYVVSFYGQGVKVRGYMNVVFVCVFACVAVCASVFVVSEWDEDDWVV